MMRSGTLIWDTGIGGIGGRGNRGTLTDNCILWTFKGWTFKGT